VFVPAKFLPLVDYTCSKDKIFVFYIE